MHRRRGISEDLLERTPPLHERSLGEVIVAEREQIERDEAGRGLVREQVHPAHGGMDALLQRLEVESVTF